MTLLRVVLIAVAAWITLGVTQRLIRLFRERITRGMDDTEQIKRAETLGRVFRYVAAVVILRCRFKVKPLEQWNVRRQFLRRLKKAFDAHAIEIPFPHLTIYAGVARDGSAPAFRVQGPGPAAGRA